MINSGKGSKATHELYKITKNQLRNFILKAYRLKDYPIKKTNHKFVADLEFHFRTLLSNSNNTVRKKFQRVGKIFDLTVKND